jgi:GWxTD domain-containing protein
LLLVSLQVSALSALVGHTVFFSPDSKGFAPYVDLYWEIEASSLAFTMMPGDVPIWSAQIEVNITLSNDTGAFLRDQYIMQTPDAPSREMATGQTILNLRRYELPSGTTTTAEVTFTEVGNVANKYTYKDIIKVESPGVCFSSGLQLLDTAYRSKTESQFQRNGMQHIPLSVPFLDDSRSALNYYFEIYGLDKVQKPQPYVLKTFISKKMNENALLKYIKTDTLPADVIVPKYGSYPIGSLESGNYYLNISVFDNDNNKLAGSSLFFQRANKNAKETTEVDTTSVSIYDTVAKKDIATLDLAKTFVAKYNHPQLVAIMKMLIPISDEVERQNIQGFLNKPDEMYSRYFVYNFWLNRNPDKPEAEWDKYAEKVREVNKMFGGGTVPGYETDRGYTYLKYGKPNERIIVTAEQGALPYEIWQYFAVKTQGRDGIFLFYKPGSMISDYKVLHTTVTGEARDMNWRNTLYPNGRNSLVDSRAEQYLRNR